MHAVCFTILRLSHAAPMQGASMMQDACATPKLSGKRFSNEQLDALAAQFRKDSFVVLQNHFDKEKVKNWQVHFLPLLKVRDCPCRRLDALIQKLQEHIEKQGHLKNRGPSRYYVTLPFTAPFNDQHFYEVWEL